MRSKMLMCMCNLTIHVDIIYFFNDKCIYKQICVCTYVYIYIYICTYLNDVAYINIIIITYGCNKILLNMYIHKFC